MNLPNRDNSPTQLAESNDQEGVLWRITLTLADTGEIVNHYLVAADDCLTLQDLLNIYHDDESFLAHAIGRPSLRQPRHAAHAALSNSARSLPLPIMTNAPPANRQRAEPANATAPTDIYSVEYESVLQFRLVTHEATNKRPESCDPSVSQATGAAGEWAKALRSACPRRGLSLCERVFGGLSTPNPLVYRPFLSP